jgi:hypothetical protein
VVAIIPAASANKKTSEKNISFHGIYILLPAIILLLSIILAACFYRLLPPEVAYHFENGSPDRWLSRGAIIAWLIIPQFIFALFALAVISIITMLSTHFRLVESAPVKKMLSVMGNIVAMPQIILTFAMLDIFLYNAYRIHLITLWVFALIIMILGGMILSIIFVQALRQFRGSPGKSL